MQQSKKEYYLGIDMGTSSIGWAVTDSAYRLLRAKGKDLWGVRLFEGANTAAKRRTLRVSRRRRQREVAKIGILKDLFADEINKVDTGFYARMEDSKYHYEDKRSSCKYSIFADKTYTDKEYYEQYPTIFHLRKELIESKEPHDIRLVYLALLNMFKHRGHFLNANLEANSNSSGIAELYAELCTIAQEQADISLPETTDITKLEEILSAKGISRSAMAEKIGLLLGINKNKEKKAYEIVKAISGLAFKAYVIFGEGMIDEEYKAFSFSFRDGNYDEKNAEMQEWLSEEAYMLIENLKQIHDRGLLFNIMRGSDFLSQARVAIYQKHKKDLRMLKDVVSKYAPESYDDIFRRKEEGSYSAYVGSVNTDKIELTTNKRRNIKRNQKKDLKTMLYDTIKNLLVKMPKDNGDVTYIKTEIEEEQFLPKQLTSLNGVIPNQVHENEMRKILANAETYLPFLKEKDESGLSVSERVLKLFTFQIPYYVGPLSAQHKGKGGNAWVVRKETGRVLPWNFEQKIDKSQSAEEFIHRMVRHCTYLNNQKVLPKASLLYERFMVLNELNNLKIRGEKPSPRVKQEIYNDLFSAGKKVKQKQLTDYLVGRGLLLKGEVDAISGIDTDFKSSLTSVAKFKGIFGEGLLADDIKVMVEQIIFWGTIYGDDKKLIQERIKENYGQLISVDNIKKISGFKFRDWGRFSREFLEMPGCDKSTGEVLPLIRMMWEKNENIMELLSDRYTYIDELKSRITTGSKELSEFEYEDLEDLYLSAPVKRMIWQTLLIMKELVGVMGDYPKRIFVEMAREEGEKGKRTESRKKKFLELYKGCKEDGRDWCKEIGDTDDNTLRSKKLYLYYTQKGRCMYSGERIELSDLFNDNKYDIDHIYPRHYVKDDSIENNLVLVKKEINQHNKKDIYPLEESIYAKQHLFWKSLLGPNMENRFITREKYNRLISRMPFTDEQLAGFINRQLVETRQGTKAVAQILEQLFPKTETEIVYVKAGNVSDFRQQRKLLKSRSVNDLHHAGDAYLNIVVGNAYYVKFTKSALNFIKEYRQDKEKNSYHMVNLFYSTIARGNEIAWEANGKEESVGTIVTVRTMMAKQTPLLTKMSFVAHGGIADQTLYGAEKAKEKGYIPLKSNDERMKEVKKYGGFSSVRIAYFFLVEHEKKGKKIRTLEAMPLYLKDRMGNDIKALEEYCEKELGLRNPSIRMKRIKMQSLIKRDGFYLHISGKSDERLAVHNAVPLYLEQKWMNYVKKIENIKNSFDKNSKDIKLDKEITETLNIELYKVLIEKHTKGIYKNRPNPIGNKLIEGRTLFLELAIEKQCEVIKQILLLSQMKNNTADFSLLNKGNQSGYMLVPKNISDSKEFILINQSITGLYVGAKDKEIDLLTI